ncbi:MAG TPA: head-tail adaptor protein [Microthrixaceae bacterium]|nr:head-tail adaptor protein [Microthrixaceae bacterium]HNG25430.1 head-tail adaptor protein [Microthrixaceae bacterium]
MTETVTILTCTTTTDRYGGAVDDWTDPIETDVPGARFAPGSTSEDLDGRAATTQTGTVYLPPDTAVTAADRIRVRGVVYVVDGVPADWQGTRVGGLAVNVKEVTG